MCKRRTIIHTGIICLSIGFTACKLPAVINKTENRSVPAVYPVADSKQNDTTSIAAISWRTYFSDQYLVALIDTALAANQELNITFQEIIIAQSEVRSRKGEYLPFAGIQAGAGMEKVSRFTNIGAMEANTGIEPGKKMPEPLQDYFIGLTAHWELDIWRKLHNAKKAALSRYFASVEGKNFVITNLIAEVANSYYELLALDNQLDMVKQNIGIQGNALEVVKLQKAAARATELAVRKFEAEVLKTKSLQFDIQQRITETENRINFLLGRYPQPIARNEKALSNSLPASVQIGIPAQLLANRPDIKRAEQDLAAAKLDVKVARAKFYPSLDISAAVGYQAFNPSYVLKTPESMLYSLAGDLVAPLINRNAIKAEYYSANARQVQAVYNYERTILNAYTEVANQMAKIGNLEKSYALRQQQVQALIQSIEISNDLFRSARADYMEVLMTQRDAIESKFELIETRKQQMNAVVNIYKALGGGWK